MVNDFVFCALALRATTRSVAPASFLINDRLSVMLSLQVFELWTRQAVQESCSRANEWKVDQSAPTFSWATPARSPSTVAARKSYIEQFPNPTSDWLREGSQSTGS